jgi:hypothetical protein
MIDTCLKKGILKKNRWRSSLSTGKRDEAIDLKGLEAAIRPTTMACMLMPEIRFHSANKGN